AAEVRNVGNPRYLFERRDHDPTLDLGKLALSLGVRLERIIINLAGWRGHRIKARRQSGRQHRVLNSLGDPLARPVNLNAVAEYDGDQRQSERALGAHQQQAWGPVQLALERNGDALLDLLGGETRRL